MTDMVVVNTEHGRIEVPEAVYELWNRYGWPKDHTLRKMAVNGNACETCVREDQ